MNDVARRIKQAVTAAIIVGALGFGATTLVASPTLTTCPDDGDVHLGTCIDTPDCTQKCRTAHPEITPQEILGKCIGGCCTCFY